MLQGNALMLDFECRGTFREARLPGKIALVESIIRSVIGSSGHWREVEPIMSSKR